MFQNPVMPENGLDELDRGARGMQGVPWDESQATRILQGCTEGCFGFLKKLGLRLSVVALMAISLIKS